MNPTRRRALLLAALPALYLLLYFPALSFMVRHPEYQRGAILWRPLPGVIKQPLFRLWSRLDPAGLDIIERQQAGRQ